MSGKLCILIHPLDTSECDCYIRHEAVYLGTYWLLTAMRLDFARKRYKLCVDDVNYCSHSKSWLFQTHYDRIIQQLLPYVRPGFQTRCHIGSIAGKHETQDGSKTQEGMHRW